MRTLNLTLAGSVAGLLTLTGRLAAQEAVVTPLMTKELADILLNDAGVACLNGAGFGTHGEGYIRFCFARDRRELTGALESLGAVAAIG